MNTNKCSHYHPDCLQAVGTHCKLLISQIDKPDCPFFKTQDDVDKGRMKAHKHLVEIGRKDLIDTYEYNAYRKW